MGSSDQKLAAKKYADAVNTFARMQRSAVAVGLALSAAPVLENAMSGQACKGEIAAIAGENRCVQPGTVFKDCPRCPEMVVLPKGEFTMGTNPAEAGHTSGELPQHSVRLEYLLAVGRYELTFDEWDACVASGGCKHDPRDAGWGRGRRPAINISWDDVTEQYLPWLSQIAAQPYRLLSESEWEYAARAGSSTPFSTGPVILESQANFDGTATYGGSTKGAYRKRTLEAGSFPPNAFGLHDMHGNVWEWVADCYSSDYSRAPQDGSPAEGGLGCQRVMRGGSWIDSPRVLRSGARGHVPPNMRFIYRGVRVARKL